MWSNGCWVCNIPLRPEISLEASYVGNHGLKMVLSSLNQNQLPPAFLAMGNAALTAPVTNPFYGLSAAAGSACGLANPTVPAFQLLLPMPQFCDSVLNTKGKCRVLKLQRS